MKLHHVGLACNDIPESVAQLRKLYAVASVSDAIYDENQNATVCLVETENGVNIELVAGERVESLLKRGISYYHLCDEVPQIQDKIESMRLEGAMLISDQQPAALFGGRCVAFLATGAGLIQLLEEENITQ